MNKAQEWMEKIGKDFSKVEDAKKDSVKHETFIVEGRKEYKCLICLFADSVLAVDLVAKIPMEVA